jgi:hypothetical protein
LGHASDPMLRQLSTPPERCLPPTDRQCICQPPRHHKYRTAVTTATLSWSTHAPANIHISVFICAHPCLNSYRHSCGRLPSHSATCKRTKPQGGTQIITEKILKIAPSFEDRVHSIKRHTKNYTSSYSTSGVYTA